MDEIIMRRLRHLQRLEENHEKDFDARHGALAPRAEQKREEIADALSADWNLKRKGRAAPSAGKPLPGDWRREHWKTLQAMARDFTGIEAANKAKAVSALEAYEAEMSPPSAL
ncbi:hypothetical protein [Roseibium aggregatum]|uniref:Uncharacterized protein n=1 Tax=Roseibium aggregatum TaxID=187304 RepID=A0A939J130_9HYPH|nr:hypothetical protein [Roseibium aggregatum]MBN9671696.1 hypothetical protein [Roseibium aggregatum]